MKAPPPPQRVPADIDQAKQHATAVRELVGRTLERASAFGEEERARRVNDEWSAVESVRHLVFVIDVWLGRTIKGEDDPFHPIGIPPHFVPRVLPGSSIDADADPTFAEARDALMGRLTMVDDYLAAIEPGGLEREIGGHAKTVAGGLGVIYDELTFHCGFINRDLDTIEAAR